MPPYLIWAILATFCCFPTGIIAIVYSVRADKHRKAGDFQRAYDFAGKAEMWSWISVVAALLSAFIKGVLEDYFPSLKYFL